MQSLRKYRVTVLVITDILIICAAQFISGFLMSKNNVLYTDSYMKTLANTIIASIVVYEAVFVIFKTYMNITRYENGKDYISYIILSMLSGGIIFLTAFLFRLPFVESKQIMLSTILISVAVVSYRVIIRFILTGDGTGVKQNTGKNNLLIIGAGEAARELIKTAKTNFKLTYNIVGLIDDNPNKIGYFISGKQILGSRFDIPRICEEKNVKTIFFSIANINSINKKQILTICQETGAKIRILPGMVDIIKNKSLLSNLRDVEIEDLLGRDAIELENENIEELIKDKCVLITGGGGSIGSELCRQVVKHNPKTLVIFDIYENNLYNIQMELRQNNFDQKTNIVAVVGSVRDKSRLDEVFKRYKPYIVFHAAAHKHVPLMEVSPLEAIKNNVFGTYNTVNIADKYNVKKFILISTDKAVNPTNIMGATKRMCEMIVQAKNNVSKTEFAAVRFGNVLGSNGSVLPLFKKQISIGGPVTVTHKEITRFFMTIPEAVGLVLQAASYAKGGEVFVLDMGEPVKIYDLAESLIKLSGLEPNVDIQIKITGLRPGEKLYEELLMSEEGLKQTAHNKIFIGNPGSIKIKELKEKIKQLKELTQHESISSVEIKETMKKIVPTYHEPDEMNITQKNSRQEIQSKIIDTAVKVKKIADYNKVTKEQTLKEA